MKPTYGKCGGKWKYDIWKGSTWKKRVEGCEKIRMLEEGPRAGMLKRILKGKLRNQHMGSVGGNGSTILGKEVHGYKG